MLLFLTATEIPEGVPVKIHFVDKPLHSLKVEVGRDMYETFYWSHLSHEHSNGRHVR